MEKSCFKVFFSKLKETRWLNEMGSKGYLLKKISDSRYFFEYSDQHTYCYYIEHPVMPLKSDNAVQHYKMLESNNITPVVCKRKFVYLCAVDTSAEYTADVCKNNASLYFWRSVYLFFFAGFASILAGYQAFAADYIIRAGHTGTGRFELSEITGTTFLDTLKTFWNKILSFLNDTYFALFRRMFGNSDASLVLAFLIPIIIVLTVLFAFNLNEYISYKSMIKKLKTDEETKGEENGKQELQH